MLNNHFGSYKLKQSAFCALTNSSSTGTPVFGAIWQPLEFLNALMNT